MYLQLQSKLRSKATQLEHTKEQVGHSVEVEALCLTRKPMTVLTSIHYLRIQIWKPLTHLTVYETPQSGVIRTWLLSSTPRQALLFLPLT